MGRRDGTIDGVADGAAVGTNDGVAVVGVAVGTLDGAAVGGYLGFEDGAIVEGARDGRKVGKHDGVYVGSYVGARDGAAAAKWTAQTMTSRHKVARIDVCFLGSRPPRIHRLNFKGVDNFVRRSSARALQSGEVRGEVVVECFVYGTLSVGVMWPRPTKKKVPRTSSARCGVNPLSGHRAQFIPRPVGPTREAQQWVAVDSNVDEKR